MRIQKSIEIGAPPERIWPFFTEPEKILKWCITFKKFEYTGEQRSGVGTPLYIEEKVGPLMKLNFEFTEWVENERLSFRMTSGTAVKAYEQRWTLEPTLSGSTFTFMEEFKLPFGILGSFMEMAGKGRSGAYVDEMLGKLKSFAEA